MCSSNRFITNLAATETVGRSAILVRPYVPIDNSAWSDYIAVHASATVFHRLAWSRAVEEAYGHRAVHLTAWSGGRLVGLLPLFLVRSLFVGRVLVSVPYATYGGILADSQVAALAIIEHAQELCRELDAEYLELRNRDSSGLELPEFGQYDTFRRALPDNPQDILALLPRKTRAAARKGLDILGADAVSMGPELLDTIYDLYSITLRRLGSPNYRRQLFHALQDGYGRDCVCLLVKDHGTAVAGVVSFVFRDEIVPYFSGSLQAGMEKFANNVMYLRLMEYAVERGLHWFDFNRTRRNNHGPHAFKRYHGFEPQPLHYQMFMNKISEFPNLSPSNRKYAVAARIWRKIPLCLTRVAGAQITKWIP